MPDIENHEMRIRQLEESLIQQNGTVRELRSEIEALGDALVVATAALESASPGSLIPRLVDAAALQRGHHNERAAKAIETLITSAREEV